LGTRVFSVLRLAFGESLKGVGYVVGTSLVGEESSIGGIRHRDEKTGRPIDGQNGGCEQDRHVAEVLESLVSLLPEGNEQNHDQDRESKEEPFFHRPFSFQSVVSLTTEKNAESFPPGVGSRIVAPSSLLGQLGPGAVAQGDLASADVVERLGEKAGGFLRGVESIEFSASTKSSRNCALRWRSRAGASRSSVAPRALAAWMSPISWIRASIARLRISKLRF